MPPTGVTTWSKNQIDYVALTDVKSLLDARKLEITEALKEIKKIFDVHKSVNERVENIESKIFIHLISRTVNEHGKEIKKNIQQGFQSFVQDFPQAILEKLEEKNCLDE